MSSQQPWMMAVQADSASADERERLVLAAKEGVVAGRMESALVHAATLAGAEVVLASRDPAKALRLAQLDGGRGIDLANGAELAPHNARVLYLQARALPRSYIDEAERVVAAKTHEYLGWLDSRS